MNNYSLTDAGLTTDDRQVAAMFLGENLSEDDDGGLLSITAEETYNPFTIRNGDGEEHDQWQITIPYPTVLSAYQPVEGEPFISEEYMSPSICYQKVLFGDKECYHKRVLMFITTRQELREFIAKVEEHIDD